MTPQPLSTLAQALDARQTGGEATVSAVSTDTRALTPGSLFVALRGPHHDGHDHLRAAQQAGAVAALVERAVECELPLLVVPDTRRALGALGRWWAQRLGVPVVAITGSNGKTSVKELIAAVLGRRGPVLATAGNLNNDIGLPLTLLRLDETHRHAVVEMGANHPGEIARLTAIARPWVGVVTNAGPAHLEGFGDIEGVARAKGELFEGLPADGIAVINVDDPYAPLWQTMVGERRRVTFGFVTAADVTAEWELGSRGSRLRIYTPTGTVDTTLALLGRHNVANALAAAATAFAAGASLDAIAEGLAAVSPLPGRLAPVAGLQGAHIIDDSYNANPASLDAAVEVLAAAQAPRWLVLGDMAELGEGARGWHAQAGRRARAAGVERLYALGPLAAGAADAFGDAAQAFDEVDALVEALHAALTGNETLLVKGSRSAGMDRVVAALRRAPASTEAEG